MKANQYEWVNNQAELNTAIEKGYTMGLSIVNDNRGKYAVCNTYNYRHVFEEITGEKYNERNATSGQAFPLSDKSFISTLFE